jgi:hypothetical protein
MTGGQIVNAYLARRGRSRVEWALATIHTADNAPVSAVFEPVSGSRKRKLKKRQQRPAAKTDRTGTRWFAYWPTETWWPELTHGIVVGSRITGDHTAETALAGWP